MSTDKSSLTTLVLSKVDTNNLQKSREVLSDDYKKVYKKATKMKLLNDKSEKGVMVKSFLNITRKCIEWIDSASDLSIGKSDTTKWNLMMLKIKMSKND